MMQIRLSLLVIAVGFLAACEEQAVLAPPPGPDDPNRPANCNIQTTDDSAFYVINAPLLVDSAGWDFIADTGVYGNIRFVARAAYDSVKWTIGTDPRVFTQNTFDLFFDQDFGPFTIQLIGYGTDGPTCSDVRIDTFARTVRLLAPSNAPIQGLYYGSLTDAPADSFLLNTFDDVWSLPGGAFEPCSTFGSSQLPSTPRITHAFRFYYNTSRSELCEFDMDGFMSENRDTLFLTYSYRIGGASPQRDTTRVFIGTRK